MKSSPRPEICWTCQRLKEPRLDGCWCDLRRDAELLLALDGTGEDRQEMAAGYRGFVEAFLARLRGER